MLAPNQQNSKARGSLFIVSGPSGVGKGTLVAAALKALPNLALSVSATTRPPRPGDVEGVDYYFKTEEEFDQLIQNGGFVEWAEVHGRRYGTLTSEVNKALGEGKDLILEIDPQGFMQVKSHMSEVVSIFIAPPSLEELKRRLKQRGTEDDQSISQRLKTAEIEIQAKDSYNVVIINDDLEKALQELVSLITQKGNIQATT
ncbi:MAG: guanylate kinase [Coriobacteriales bacterium]|nr:guanylate kinase [Coriobacteriales bacterium]